MDDGKTALKDHKLAETNEQHVVDLSFERVDLAGWLFSLSSFEFQRCCPPDHIGFGMTMAEGGLPMTTTVEAVGEFLLVQHYLALVHRPDFCELVSTSDVFPATGGRTRMEETWTLRAEALDDERTTCTNTLVDYATKDFMHYLENMGTSFETAAFARQAASADHISRETANYGVSIALWSGTATNDVERS